MEDPGGPAVAAPTVADNLTIPAGDESSQISLNSASAPPSPRSEVCLLFVRDIVWWLSVFGCQLSGLWFKSLPKICCGTMSPRAIPLVL